jgi:type I restriction enzyme S subunit
MNVPRLRFKEFSGEWGVKKLGYISTFSKGKGISKADIDENGTTFCIRYGELYTEYGETIRDVKSKTNIKWGIHTNAVIPIYCDPKRYLISVKSTC